MRKMNTDLMTLEELKYYVKVSFGLVLLYTCVFVYALIMSFIQPHEVYNIIGLISLFFIPFSFGVSLRNLKIYLTVKKERGNLQ